MALFLYSIKSPFTLGGPCPNPIQNDIYTCYTPCLRNTSKELTAATLVLPDPSALPFPTCSERKAIMRSMRTRSGQRFSNNGNSNQSRQRIPRQNHEVGCLSGCIQQSTIQGEIVWYLPSSAGFIETIPHLLSHFSIVLLTPSQSSEEANAGDLYQCAIVSIPIRLDSHH